MRELKHTLSATLRERWDVERGSESHPVAERWLSLEARPAWTAGLLMKS